MTYQITTTDDNTARELIQAHDAHIALIRIEAMLWKYNKYDNIEDEDLIAEYYDITDGLWLPE